MAQSSQIAVKKIPITVCTIFSSGDLDIVTNASDDVLYKNDDVDRSSPIAESQQTQNKRRRKRGRPKKAKDMKDWEDNEIEVLVELWSQYENLFNTKHKNYFNRDIRQKSLENIKLKLEEQNIIATEKQISEKLTNLKNYYGGQKRLIDSRKANSTGFPQVYQSNWKFFSSLTFLQNAFTPRGTYCNGSESPAVDTVCPPSSKSARKSEAAKRDTVQKVLETEAQVTELMAESNEKKETIQKGQNCLSNQDKIFCDLIYALLRDIPDSEDRDLMKLNIQQMLIKKKHQR